MFAALATGTFAQAVQHSYHADTVLAPTMIARDACAELPRLCTDLVMLHDTATTLTYLCPEATGPSTVHITQTITTTVTVSPTTDSDTQTTEAPIEDPVVSEDSTTTTTIRSTITEHRTITLYHKSSFPATTTASLLEEDASDSPKPMLPVITDWLSEEASTTQFGHNVTSSIVAPTAIYWNNTSGYAKPTISLNRGAKASESASPYKGTAGHHGVPSLISLILGMMVVAATC